ncbi:MAG: PhoH family protein, partial [Acidobacteriota bacterium]
NLKQRLFIQAVSRFDSVFAVGPAGTGKTYLAVALAAAALADRRVRRIVLTRPAVEAGERLGFLPGDLVEKVNPYLRPVYDALYDILGYDTVARHLERGVIEIAPLAFMRGRTLNDSFILLDEAQNTTPEQMKMFLTRMGFHSKAVITGDVTQIDLPVEKLSGLVQGREILDGVAGVCFFDFAKEDVVRHRLVEKVVAAYEQFEAQRKRGGP